MKAVLESKKKEELLKKYTNIWEKASEEEKADIFAFAESYKDFISYSKTERRAVGFALKLAKAKGYVDFSEKKTLKAGDKIYFINRDKNIVLYKIGKKGFDAGIRMLAAHLDAPRLDLKPNPLYEDAGIALLDTHYYGGIKKYQWTAIPLALYGVAYTQKGQRVEISIGDDANDPVFYISDLLIHLSKDQMKKSLDEGVSGENLDVICGSIPLKKTGAEKEDSPIKRQVVGYLKEKYDLIEEDLVGSELEIVPAGFARDIGFDRSLIAGYGHDDRSCSFAALRAILDLEETPEKTSCVLLVDKEEIGSYGNTGLESDFFIHTLMEVIEKRSEKSSHLDIRRCLRQSLAISADVGAAFDPNYPEVNDKKNTPYLNKGVVLKKYTGSRGKSGASDSNAEFISAIRKLLSDNGISWQAGELGKVDQGGGGTVAFILAKMNMDVLDIGIPVLSMHAPVEAIGKADLYMAYQAYQLFLKKAEKF